MLLKSHRIDDHETTLNQYTDVYLKTIKPKKNRTKLLLVVPDDSRFHSGAPEICRKLYESLKNSHHFSFLIATGTHEGMNKKRIEHFYKGIPSHLFENHHFLKDCIHRGSITRDEIKKLTHFDFPFDTKVEANKALFDENYDLIISIGQVVPHEVCGFSNYTKNLAIGLGSKDVIDKTHYLSALVGVETLIGEAFNPARSMVDYAMEKLKVPTPIHYILSVVDPIEHHIDSIYITNKDEGFFMAARRSKKINVFKTEKRYDNVYAFMSPFFKSSWIANKAIYRLRKIVADKGKLHIIAPGVKCFGEDPLINEIIESCGYPSDLQEIKALEKKMEDHLAVLAHLIHSCPENRFDIIYYVGESYLKIFEKARLTAVDLREAPQIENLSDPKSFVCENPSLGLWIL